MNGKGVADSLPGVTALWPTPSASNPNDTEDTEAWRARQAKLKAKHGNNGAGEPLAIVAREMWPTPRTITGGAESAQRKQQLGRMESGGGDLQAAAQMWPTATATDARSSGSAGYDSPKAGTTLTDAVRGRSPGRQVPPIEPPGLPSSSATPTSLRLSATFVEWLMNFPKGWTLALTDCAVSVTPSSPNKPPQHFDT